jgi:hypothetical protein
LEIGDAFHVPVYERIEPGKMKQLQVQLERGQSAPLGAPPPSWHPRPVTPPARTGPLLIRVLDESGKPIRGAAISSDCDGDHVTATDSLGEAVFKNCWVGLHQIAVRGGGYSTQEFSLRLPEATPESLEVRLIVAPPQVFPHWFKPRYR